MIKEEGELREFRYFVFFSIPWIPRATIIYRVSKTIKDINNKIKNNFETFEKKNVSKVVRFQQITAVFESLESLNITEINRGSFVNSYL